MTPHRPSIHLRRSLFRRYFVALFIAVVVPLFAKGISDAWFGYRDQRTMLNALLQAEATSAATRIRNFLEGIREQLGWTVQQAWAAGTEEQHRLDALRLLRQVPSVFDVTLTDEAWKERVYVSRVELNRIGSGKDLSLDPARGGIRSTGVWYSPVRYYINSEPRMTIAVTGNRRAAGVAIAEINLKLIRDVISSIRVGKTGYAFVLDQSGRLIAHPDMSKVLRGPDYEGSESMRRFRKAILDSEGGVITTKDADDIAVVATMALIPDVDLAVYVEQPVSEAFAPIYAALWRTAGLLLAGVVLAGLLAYLLARSMSGPIRLLEEGAGRIGAGQFDHRIQLATGDELEQLATRFNRMAEELAVSQERSERIDRLKRFLAPQIAELVEKAGNDSLLASQRVDVVALFCDLRGFTAFSTRTEPDEIMRVLAAYHQALGSIIASYGATLTNFSGDGLMVLINAPVPCAQRELRAVEMAIDMQSAVQGLIVGWSSRGYTIGFGVGLAMGPATVGQVGYESRVEYTAIGNAVNLASRLCALAEDQQILVDPAVAEAVRDKIALVALGARTIKGYDEPLPVYSVGSCHRSTGKTPEDYQSQSYAM